ncbi:hypothetical protein H0H92_001114 [Tricholoma furcatifolium]|nr:hypothetical protein H0H92_001114 [Tricholoma furcatifolium]
MYNPMSIDEPQEHDVSLPSEPLFPSLPSPELSQLPPEGSLPLPSSSSLPSTVPFTIGPVSKHYTQPQCCVDALPEPLAPVILPQEIPQSELRFLPRVFLIVRDRLVTAINSFGIWRDYQHRPSYDPTAHVAQTDLIPSSATSSSGSTLPFIFPPPFPFRNMSIYRLMTYFNSGSTTKLLSEADRLVKEVLCAPDFTLSDLKGFSAARENARLDKAIKDNTSSPFFRQFSSTSVEIDVPSGQKNIPSQKFLVPGLLYRKLTTVIEAAFHSSLAHHFHLTPFKLFRRLPTTGEDERVMGELDNSDSFLKEHDLIQRRAPVPLDDPNCKREKIIAALMFSSDATHLTNFGMAKAWPIYLMLGNLSKYFCSSPNSGAMYHLAYIPSLPDSFQDFASQVHCKWETQKKGIITHCCRELMHAIWKFLLDDNFVHAYKFGMVIKCIKGVEHRVYPHIFTYSADYPEK